MELNVEQMKVVQEVDGPVIVFAGAGSGKTRTLTFRIAHMVLDSHISPYNILAITFTNKATNEMKERLQSFKDINIKGITISTFHALCAMILRREIEALGYKKDFSIVDEDDQLKVIADVIKELNLEKGKAKYCQKQINYAKCFMTKADSSEYKDLIKVAEKYEERMLELNLLDFEDLLIKVYELFAKNPEILKKYQQKYQYILVDEFQDTNLIQYKIVKMLAINHHNLFVVGDDDQSIYSFRGTNYENMNLFKKDFPEYKSFTLCENYRSSQSILNFANRLINNNKNREPKNMTSEIPGSTDDVVIYSAEDEKKEVDYVLNEINSLKGSLIKYDSFAILYRSSVLLRNFELGLIRRHIPYKVYGGVSYLRRKEVKDIIAYFQFIIDPNDWMSFKRIVNTPSRGIGEVTIEKIEKIKKTYKVDILDAIQISSAIISKARYDELMKFKELIDKYRDMVETTNLLLVFDRLVYEIKYEDFLKETYDKNDAEDRIANLHEFKSVLYGIENSTSDENKFEKLRSAFDDALLSDSYLQSQKESWDGITLSTVHSVKGLEYDYVFIVGMEENIFPNNMRIMSDSELEEERRIAYVAITRARKRVYMLHCQKRLLYGSSFANKPSRFIIEGLGVKESQEVIECDPIRDEYNSHMLENKHQEIKLDKKPLFVDETSNEAKTNYKVGDVVIHKKFGEGIILAIDNDIGSIFFSQEKCTKSLLLDHPALRKKNGD